MALIEIENISKHFRVLNRREGLKGAFLGLFSGDYRTVKAVDDISFSIDAGEMPGGAKAGSWISLKHSLQACSI